MRVLTVRQPWACAIAHLGKDVENRPTNIAGGYRGPVAIHAGLREDEAAYDDEMIRQACGEYDDGWLLADWVGITGAVVGVVDLVDVHHSSNVVGIPTCRCSPWAMHDRWHLVLTNVRPLRSPIPHKGALGLRTAPPALQAAIREQLAA